MYVVEGIGSGDLPALRLLDARNADDLRQLVRPAQVVTPDQYSWAQKVGLVERLVALMRKHDGVGLAAPQVGLPWRLIVTGTVDLVQAYWNPKIVARDDAARSIELEGCLSLPGRQVLVSRAHRITVETGSPDAPVMAPATWTFEAAGFEARVLQHEIDHLDGILITDGRKS